MKKDFSKTVYSVEINQNQVERLAFFLICGFFMFFGSIGFLIGAAVMKYTLNN